MQEDRISAFRGTLSFFTVERLHLPITRLSMGLPAVCAPCYTGAMSPGEVAKPAFDVTIFALGCVGALAPEIVRLYNLRQSSNNFVWNSYYVVVSLLFMPLGGIIAWILPATSLWGAFYVGVSTPVLINSILKEKPKAAPKTKKEPAPKVDEVERMRSHAALLRLTKDYSLENEDFWTVARAVGLKVMNSAGSGEKGSGGWGQFMPVDTSLYGAKPEPRLTPSRFWHLLRENYFAAL